MKTISVLELKQKNKAAGHYFFSPATIKGFNSIVYPGLITECGLIVFVTSERDKYSNKPRMYTVRLMNENGHVQCSRPGFEFDTKKAAVEFMQTLGSTINYRYPFDLIQIDQEKHLIYLYDSGVYIRVYTVNNALHTSYNVPVEIRKNLAAVDELMTSLRYGVDHG